MGTGRQAMQEKAEQCTRLFSKAAAEKGGWVEGHEKFEVFYRDVCGQSVVGRRVERCPCVGSLARGDRVPTTG